MKTIIFLSIPASQYPLTNKPVYRLIEQTISGQSHGRIEFKEVHMAYFIKYHASGNARALLLWAMLIAGDNSIPVENLFPNNYWDMFIEGRKN